MVPIDGTNTIFRLHHGHQPRDFFLSAGSLVLSGGGN